MKPTPSKRKRAQKAAWRKKYGKVGGDLLLRYRSKIAAQAKAKAAARRAARK